MMLSHGRGHLLIGVYKIKREYNTIKHDVRDRVSLKTGIFKNVSSYQEKLYLIEGRIFDGNLIWWMMAKSLT